MPIQQMFLGSGGAGIGEHYYFTFPTSDNYPTPHDIHLDSSGNLYVCGKETNSAAFVTKFDDKGVLQWARKYSSSSVDFRGVVTDSSGNVYVGGHASYYGARFLIVKYNSSGVLQWERELGNNVSSEDTKGYCITIDNFNNVYIGGYTDHSESYSSDRYMLAKYNSSGTIQFQKELRLRTYLETVHNIEYSSSIYGFWVCGLTYQLVGSANICLSKYNNGGSHIFSRLLRGLNGCGDSTYRSFDIATHGSDVYLTGGLDHDGHGGGSDITISKYNSSGTEQWCRIIGSTTASELARGVAADSSGNVYVLGFTNNYPTNKLIILKLNSSGVLQWQRTFGGPQNEYVSGPNIKVDNSGNFYIVFQSGSPNVYNPSSGVPRLVTVVKLPDDGTLTGTYGHFTYAASSYLDSPRSSFSNITISNNPTNTDDNTTSLTSSSSVPSSTDSALNPTISALTYFADGEFTTPPPAGQQAYTSAGSYTWTCPSGITSVSVVCVGAGAGCGGALAYKNNITVVPGTGYTVVVGSPGVSSGAGSGYTVGGDSSFSATHGTTTAQGGKGTGAGNQSNKGAPAGTYDGGGEGGEPYQFGGYNGAGAGGYSGDGGDAGIGGSGSGGSGGAAGAGGWAYWSGGGVGLFGEGSSGGSSSSNGNGGSGGQDGQGEGSNGGNSQVGGNYGGGGSGRWSGNTGGKGAVRIIWPGDVRQFPTTRTADE